MKRPDTPSPDELEVLYIMGSKFKALLENPKFRNFLRSPELAMLLLVFASIAIIWASTLHHHDIPDNRIVPAVADSEELNNKAVTTTAANTTKAATTSVTTTTEETTTEETTTESSTTVTEAPTTAAPETTAAPAAEETSAATEHHDSESRTKVPGSNVSQYINAGTSPNSDFYQQRIYIAGDSIAYGFNAYGFIPDYRNLAQESVSMWNLDGFTFGGGYSLVDAVSYSAPELLYMSIGMNDVNMNDTYAFAGKYTDVIEQILSRCPDINIVVAGITPIGYESTFTSNERIREYNSALEYAVNSLESPRVYYFDAYSVVSDEYGALRYDCSGGDGIHLQSHCYGDFLSALFNFLDDTSVKEQIEKAER